MINNEQVPPAEQEELTVGQLFKQEREQRKLTLEQVAKQLNLKIEVIQSLEADQPDKAILPTFMRGYVRAYARFLKLPEQPLLTRFEQVHKVQSAPIKAMKTFSNRQAKQQTEKRFMWFTYVIVAILLASLAAWVWQGARDFTSEAADITSEALNSDSAEPLSENPIIEANPAIPQIERLAVIEQTKAIDTADTANTTVMLENKATEQSDSTVLVDTSSESFGDSNDSGLDRLKMTFNDDCWIDVLDVNGERIAFGTKQGGYIMELNARGPFTITLGNPSAVAIDINQQPFDMSGFPGGRVAKFTLAGQDE